MFHPQALRTRSTLNRPHRTESSSGLSSAGSMHNSISEPLSEHVQDSSAISAISSAALSARRTRKRFRRDQIIILEQMYHMNSHPSREEREKAADDAGLDVKSVTIWFQNKRQMERKTALHNASSRNNSLLSLSDETVTQDGEAEPHPKPLLTTKPLRSSLSRLSLDLVASRTESCAAVTRTTRVSRLTTPVPVQSHSSTLSAKELLEAMPSSPVHDRDRVVQPFPTSCDPRRGLAALLHADPSDRPRKRSLEWACAVASINPEISPVVLRTAPSAAGQEDQDQDTEADTDDEMHDPELQTPSSSVNLGLTFLGRKIKTGVKEREGKGSMMTFKSAAAKARVDVEDDVMSAAWTLYGLSRR